MKPRYEASLLNVRRKAEKTWYLSLERCAKRRTISQLIRHSLNTIVLPNINYALSVYAASYSDLTPVQCFLGTAVLKYTSKPVSVYDLLKRQERKIFRTVVPNSIGHPLLSYEKKLILNLRLILCVLNTLSLTI